jgi:hypothetical protein
MFSFLTSDGVTVPFDYQTASKFRFGIADDFQEGVIPLENISEKILKNILSFVCSGVPVPKEDLIETCLAADFLFNQETIDHCAKAIADSLRGMTADQVKKAYNGAIGEALRRRTPVTHGGPA